MDLNTVLLLVMGLACPIGMGAMMWLMNKKTSEPQPAQSYERWTLVNATNRLAQLQEQRKQLDAELSQLSHAIEAQLQREQLPAEPYEVVTSIPATVYEDRR